MALQKRVVKPSALEGRSFDDTIRDPFVYFDTYVLAAGGGTITLFNNSANSGKTAAQTNYSFQQLPSGQAFDIQGIRVSYYAHALMADATQQLFLDWCNTCVFELHITNLTAVYQRPLASLLGGQVQAVTAPAVTVNSKNLSSWTADTVIRFKNKVYVDQQVQATVDLVQMAAPNAALSGDYLRVEWLGRRTKI